MTVAPNKISCPDRLGGTSECLLVKLDKYAHVSNVWGTFEDRILGFEHQPGYRYRILVNVTSYSSPIGDPPPPSYSLKQVLEKTFDSTIAVPGQP